MRNRIWSLLLVSGTAALLTLACGGDDKTTVLSDGVPGKAGESCTKRADCGDELSCIQGVCQVSASTGAGGAGTAIGPALGKKGESCTKRADCATGLSCFAQLCADKAPTAVTPPDPKLGAYGESCVVGTDCGEGLSCQSQMVGYYAAASRCEVATFGLTPTGKSCEGECAAPADCCHLPLDSGYASCKDLESTLGGAATAKACTGGSTTPLKKACFAYQTYCNCTASTWSCTDNQCVYKAPCDESTADLPGGCPLLSRLGNSLPTTCDSTALKCQPLASVPVCTSDTDCDTKVVADRSLDACTTGECICLKSAGQCYRKCNSQLDCEKGYACDATTKVCVASGACDNDAYCARQLNNVKAVCVDKKECKTPCTSDLQCSPSGIVDLTDYANSRTRYAKSDGFNGRVCSKGFCEDLGCSSDAECSSSSNLKKFCVTPKVTVTQLYKSAITD